MEETVEQQELKEGFTWRTAIGAMFIGFIMMPGAIYLGLVAGMGMGSAAQWVTIVLFTEITRRSFAVLRKQEIYILYYIAGGIVSTTAHALAVGPIANLIWSQYLVQSPQAISFGIADKIPRWVVPPRSSPALLQRTFLHSAWIVPILILVISHILARLNWLGLGYTLFRITSKVEKLEFPMAPVAAQGATALAEVSTDKESWRWRIFSIGAMIGLVFGFFYVGIPALTGTIMSKPLQLIPIPFIDLTPNIQQTPIKPSIMGINTDLGTMLMGFVLPWPMVASQFITSMATQILINPLIHYYFKVFPSYRDGMGTITASIALDLDFWMSVGIGGALTVFVFGLFSVIKTMLSHKTKRKITTFNSTQKAPDNGELSVKIAVGIWLLSTFGNIILCHKLVPAFPILLFIFYGFIWTPLNSYISARMLGLTGQGGIAFPYVKEGTFVLSKYKDIDVWFAPIPLFNWGSSAQFFKEVELTGTKLKSILKAELIMFPIIFLGGFLFWSFFWKFSSIPSSAYPYAQTFWPKEATYQCLWTTANTSQNSWLLKAIKGKLILGGGLSCLAAFSIFSLFKLPSVVFYGMIAGIGAWPHHTIPMFMGGLLGKYYISPKVGSKNWKNYAPVLLAGYGCGMGLVGMACIALALISKSVLYLPF